MGKANLRVRAAGRGDAGEIGGMAVAFAAYLRKLGDKTHFQFNVKTYLRDGWGKNPAFKGLVAEIGGQPVGYLLYCFGYDTDRAIRLVNMLDLYVKEEYRRQGVGQALMARVSKIAAKAGAKRLFWSVYAHNTNAQGFYRHVGARPVKDTLYMWVGIKARTDSQSA
jgi:ribosomal protein S18 acetylase RimI-like enzyme